MASKLGEFIRLHRERIKPQHVGLSGHGRRRTPGLRREELAQLCEVSPTWLTWLEQGRQVAPSAKVLARLADLLQLSAAERAYLFRLADRLDPAAASFSNADEAQVAQHRAIVAAISVPAYIINRRWDALAWNSAAEGLFAGWLGQAKAVSETEAGEDVAPANLLHYMFSNPQAKELIVDWPARAQRVVAEFRADCGKHADQEPFASLIESLSTASRELVECWRSQQVLGREGGLRRFQHPVQGALAFDQVSMQLATSRETKVVMLLPSYQ